MPPKDASSPRCVLPSLFLSEKHAIFSDRTRSGESMQSIDNHILRRIYSSGRGSVFTPTQFTDLGSRDAIDKGLSRLSAAGTLRRLTRGVYDYPKTHPTLGELLPSPDAIAKALAGRHQIRLQPAGAYAANLLGLSEQVPAKIVFLTDGPTRTVKIGPMGIQLRRTTPRNMATAGRLSGLIIQALRHLGQEHITPERIASLKHTLPIKERNTLAKDLRLAPAWMQPILRELAAED